MKPTRKQTSPTPKHHQMISPILKVLFFLPGQPPHKIAICQISVQDENGKDGTCEELKMI